MSITIPSGSVDHPATRMPSFLTAPPSVYTCSILSIPELNLVVAEQGSSLLRGDPRTRRWVQGSDYPNRCHAAGFHYQRYMYAAYGADNNMYRRYDAHKNSWDSVDNLPTTMADYAGQSGYDGSNTYFMIGTTNFYRYNIATNNYTSRASTPDSMYEGSAMVKVGGYLYCLSYISRSILRYDISGNSWSILATCPLSSVGYKPGITTDGSDYVYLVVEWTLWRYSISGNSYALLAFLPYKCQRSAAHYYNHPIFGNVIFIARGNETKDLLIYKV